MQDPYQPVVDGFLALRNRTIDEKARAREAHPDWHVNQDPRIGLLAKLEMAFGTVGLALMHIQTGLRDPAWWATFTSGVPPARELKWFIYGYDALTKVGFFITEFSIIESTCRVLLRALDPSPCDGARGGFKCVITELLDKRLGFRAEDLALLDLMRLLRNTIHNNGVYLEPHRRDQRISYKHRDYGFEDGKPIDFADWETVLLLSGDALDLSIRLVNHPEIARLPATLTDPFAAQVPRPDPDGPP